MAKVNTIKMATGSFASRDEVTHHNQLLNYLLEVAGTSEGSGVWRALFAEMLARNFELLGRMDDAGCEVECPKEEGK